ncbi:hypothetical protein BELL_0472g00060 [Botrytis elliptica]|uniref:Uncharacterized protein n=1 Tax=Botrytis elliptica TaxID=278938 RepID=A0A4Z1JEX0_9HELO|nr:hypothetical protein BELL_0472g00060 [Botrytis elliptica]
MRREFFVNSYTVFESRSPPSMHNLLDFVPKRRTMLGWPLYHTPHLVSSHHISYPRPPPLFPALAIKLPLPQLPIHIIVGLAHPLSKLSATFRAHLVLGHVGLEIGGAGPAGVELGEEAHEGGDVGAVGGGGAAGVGSGERVQEGPGGAAEGFDVGGAVGWGGGGGLRGLERFGGGGEGGEGVAGAAAEGGGRVSLWLGLGGWM